MKQIYEDEGLSQTKAEDSPVLVIACYFSILNINVITHQNAEMMDLGVIFDEIVHICSLIFILEHRNNGLEW